MFSFLVGTLSTMMAITAIGLIRDARRKDIEPRLRRLFFALFLFFVGGVLVAPFTVLGSEGLISLELSRILQIPGLMATIAGLLRTNYIIIQNSFDRR